jgi:hypothetical protein
MVWSLPWAISNHLNDQDSPDFMKPKVSSPSSQMLGIEPSPGSAEPSSHLHLALRSTFLSSVSFSKIFESHISWQGKFNSMAKCIIFIHDMTRNLTTLVDVFCDFFNSSKKIQATTTKDNNFFPPKLSI